MSRDVYVIGVGMTAFKTPKQSGAYTDMGAEATRTVLQDAGITYDDVDRAYVGYLFGDTCAGQRALYEVGMSGIPIVNVNDACATGSIALYLAREAVETGVSECALALGFEQMSPGAPPTLYTDRPTPWDKMTDIVNSKFGETEAPMAINLFGGAAREYIQRYKVSPEAFGKITIKARQHASRNPNAVFTDQLTLEQVMESPMFYDPITRLQCCPPTCGAAAAIVCSKEFAARHQLKPQVRIAAQAVQTDTDSTLSGDPIKVVGFDMARKAAQAVYEQAGIGPEDIKVIELHDCFASNELMTYEALGLAAEGEGVRLVEDGDNTYGGKYIVNPSGGLISKGHPIGATGLAQCAELNWQLRGEADQRQVEGTALALQHNLGLGGACVVTLYEKAA